MADRDENEYVFTWVIENYSACYKEKGKKIRSPVFKIENMYGSRWILDFYPNGCSFLEEEEKFVSCFLSWVGTDQHVEMICIDCCIEIVSEKNGVLTFYEFDHVFGRKFTGCGSVKFFDIDKLAEEMGNWEEDILVLRCRMCNSFDLDLEQNYSASEACTKNGVDRCCADWDVKLPMLMEYSESIVFPMAEDNQFEVTLISDMESVEIYFQFKEAMSELPLRITFKITMFDFKCCKLKSKRAVHLFKASERWQFPSFITKDMLESCETDSSRCDFKLICDACVWNKSVSSHSIVTFKSNFASKSAPKIKNSLQDEFRRLFISKQYSDITIRAVGGEFSAHKMVLKVRSPVFAVMFEQDMLETKTGVVNITDMDVETLKAFLEFLYTGTVNDMDYDIAKHLMLAADKYQVPSLKEESASFLKSKLSVDNACEVLSMADLFGCEALKSYSLHFIKFNADKILPTAAWTQLIKDNIKVATLVLSDLSLLIHTKYKFR